MLDRRDFEPLFFAPFVSSLMGVEPSWIDYNGHLNVAASPFTCHQRRSTCSGSDRITSRRGGIPASPLKSTYATCANCTPAIRCG